MQQQRKILDWDKEWDKKPRDDFYLDSDPKYFVSAHDFGYVPKAKTFSPTLHRTRGYAGPGSYDIIEVVVCKCGKSQWRFYERASQQKPEIVFRKGKYCYPDFRYF
jgi:hypothetical protein